MLLAAALSGCVATQRDMLELSQQTDTLALQMHELKKSIGSLQANQAELATKLDQLHTDVSVFTETLKDSQQGMSSLSSKMDDLGTALGSKVSSLGQNIDEQRRMLQEREEQRRKLEEDQARARKEQEEREADEKRRAAAAPTPGQLYKSALVQLNAGKHDLAAQGFELYLKRYPKGESADDATYNLGQTRFAQKRFEDAARQFALVLDRWPKSKLTPSARLMYAQALIEMKQHLDEAQRYLQSIPDDFPRSPEAKKAKELLDDLKTPAKP